MDSLSRLAALDAPHRLAARDASLFSADPIVQAEVTQNLGWTRLAADAAEQLPLIRRLAREIASDQLTDVVLLGMGGSSLTSLVLGHVLADDDGPRLHVLDTTSPVTVLDKLSTLNFETTLFVVSSKSGATIEPLSLYSVFRHYVEHAVGNIDAGSRFIAVTDPGSQLEALAASEGFRDVVSSPPTVGGRYSALSVFGLLPAALLGIDLDTLLQRARSMEASCSLPAEENPAALLAAFATDAHALGREKLTLVASPGLESFGLWVEQLVAESLGKQGTGILPVVDLSAAKPLEYGPDRAIAVVRFADDDRLSGWAAEWSEHYPVVELVLRDGYDVAAEFVRWEHAVALMGPLLDVNPFGQPNVAAAKAATATVLSRETVAPAPQGQLPDGQGSYTFAGALSAPGHPEATMGNAIGHAVASIRTRDFLAVLAYLPDNDELLAPLQRIVPPVSAALGVPVTLELGPRYLHSTGQYHKGGPNIGVFILVTTADATDVTVPGEAWGLRDLHRAQAEGDLVTLAEAGRRVLRLDLADASPESVATLVRGLADAAGVVYEE